MTMLNDGIMENTNNNFHRLLDEELNGAPPLPPQIKQNVQRSMGFVQFLGKALELYVPNALDTVLIAINGGESENASSHSFEENTPDDTAA